MKAKVEEYQVKYLVKAIIGITVKAKSFDEAKEKADKIQGKMFAGGVEYLDGKDIFIGYDNCDAWKFRD